MNKLEPLPKYSLALKDKDSHKASTALEVFKSTNPCIEALVKQNSVAEVKKAIHSIIYDAMVLMFPEQSEVLAVSLMFAEDIVDTRPDWKSNDIDLFFKFIRRAQGNQEDKLFGKISILWLNQMIPKYEDYKSEEREKMHQELKRSTPDELPAKSEKTEEYIKSLKQILSHNKPEKKEAASSPITEQQKRHNVWMRNFDKVKIKKPIYSEGGVPLPFIDYYDNIGRKWKRVDITEYLMFKERQYSIVQIMAKKRKK